MQQLWQRFRGWPKGAQIAVWVLVGFIVLGIIGAATAPDDEGEQVVITSTTGAPEATRVPTSAVIPSTGAPTTGAPTTALPVTTRPPTTTAPPRGERVLQTFSGSGQSTTRPFRVDARWEIRWQASGDIFQIYVFEENGTINGVAANQQGAGSGQAFQPKGGSYYLQMNAIGAWTVTVVQLP